jgi:amino acid permease
MPKRRLLLVLLTVLVAGCAIQGEAGHMKASRGLGAAWAAFWVALFGVLLPDIAAKWTEFEDRSLTRLAAGALLLFSSICLANYYFGFDPLDHLTTAPGRFEPHKAGAVTD